MKVKNVSQQHQLQVDQVFNVKHKTKEPDDAISGRSRIPGAKAFLVFRHLTRSGGYT